MMRVLGHEGILFLRMTTGFGGMQEVARELGEGRYLLPDGSQRFLLTEALLDEVMRKHELFHLERPKSVLVHGQRAMGAFVMKKS